MSEINKQQSWLGSLIIYKDIRMIRILLLGAISFAHFFVQSFFLHGGSGGLGCVPHQLATTRITFIFLHRF